MGKEKENAQETGEVSEEVAAETPPPPSKAISLIDFMMRIVAAVSTMGSAIAVATTTTQTLPSTFTNFIRFNYRQYQDFPTFTFFVVSNAIATAYLVLSLALSIFHIFKTGAKVTRTVLIIVDTTILSLLTAGASAAAAIAYIAHKGNDQAKWMRICERYNSLCERVSGALVGSFMGILALMLLVFLNAVALSRK
ncbi:hypothetical protein C2S53_007563 [Perilla frutescens var. hirtella]|uniref:CASP-like protein n=1 Tax=Perilla frutescens var. hirtella TaxID=608512 RepID=A0AAD4P965_PERFH|nr:hypothetical protein C2S53_007563 [Perilla frutescens var. hirtella]